ncbi:cob(I)yrinic acid a,c-diamide adenosyltransferase [Oscillospiraceae bacterium MB08-C2-2]|nr:cob(I)yrinic acid a,c-diamide adenosyltransferase [Oscillospiraceae bacterium MB08-C2-2]
MEKGYIQVYTGNGKGKTTALLGLALRACGAGLGVYLGQFLKEDSTSEIQALKAYLPQVTVEQYGPGYFIAGREPNEQEKAMGTAGLEKARVAMLSGKYSLILLDEINVALSKGLVELDAVLALMEQKPAGVELVLTGRGAMPEIIEAADLVTEMREIKHYYKDGVQARVGIER